MRKLYHCRSQRWWTQAQKGSERFSLVDSLEAVEQVRLVEDRVLAKASVKCGRLKRERRDEVEGSSANSRTLPMDPFMGQSIGCRAEDGQSHYPKVSRQLDAKGFEPCYSVAMVSEVPTAIVRECPKLLGVGIDGRRGTREMHHP
jgi:hypothetical protein